MKERLIRFLDWSREHPAAFTAIAICSVAFFGFCVGAFSLYPMSNANRTPESRLNGFYSLYPRVREGDEHFIRGEYTESSEIYQRALRDFRSLQEEFPKRASDYRDAERVVQSRLSLSNSAAGLRALTE